MIASKAEESAKSLRDFAAVFYTLRRARSGGWRAMEPGPAYDALTEMMVAREQLILRRLAFDVRPAGETMLLHVLTLNLVHALCMGPAVAQLAVAQLADVAFPHAHFLHASTAQLACATVWLADALVGGGGEEVKRSWWTALGVSDAELAEAVRNICHTWGT
jgi:hypothetical protein